MSEGKLVHNFKSYLRFGEEDLQVENDVDDETLSKLKPRLLAGEQIIAETPRVLMYSPVGVNNKAVLGVLTVTNFKVCFMSCRDKNQIQDEFYQSNRLLQPYEVCLSCIDTVYQLIDKKKKEIVLAKVPEKIKDLLIICKNFRMLTFSFKYSPIGSSKKATHSILHHSKPLKHNLLFLYEYSALHSSQMKIKMFQTKFDWLDEMERTKASKFNWRVSLSNENYQLSIVLPQFIVVPASLFDDALEKAAEHFRNGFIPIWTWNASNGAALVRSSDLYDTIHNRAQETIMFENVRKCHPFLRQPKIIDLTSELPSIRDIYNSYLKLRDLCTPISHRQFRSQDREFYSLVESTKWLQSVSSCLQKALDVAEVIVDDETTTILQEGTGMDIACLVSSLVQILLDSHFRTIAGFETLIQKEWLALGHPFATRLGHFKVKDEELSPVFLLFLDCVWQLLRQHPSAFEFSEVYLTTVWDTAHVSVFETFFFDSQRKRQRAATEHVTLRSAWDWSLQFSAKDIDLLYNVLHNPTDTYRLRPDARIFHLELWTLCYFRWLPVLEIPFGGPAQIDHHYRMVARDIERLRAAQVELTKDDVDQSANEVNMRVKEDLREKITSFYPFSCNIANHRNSVVVNEVLADGDGVDAQSIRTVSDMNMIDEYYD